ncbi:hypothetical protein RF11_14562 [Thelohanellus kitauei]|uniref:Uncharacterized protein n=1 Tax=Thelohanellus kitauei TaxID=669202 RepID=A0A0C2MTX9_THEKT|nr:hypothetical protein RF11_14562 [Thelohanellus kitauei]
MKSPEDIISNIDICFRRKHKDICYGSTTYSEISICLDALNANREQIPEDVYNDFFSEFYLKRNNTPTFCSDLINWIMLKPRLRHEIDSLEICSDVDSVLFNVETKLKFSGVDYFLGRCNCRRFISLEPSMSKSFKGISDDDIDIYFLLNSLKIHLTYNNETVETLLDRTCKYKRLIDDD